jgi:hypothetical protein
MRRTLGLGAAALLVLALGFASAASAQVVYQMSGEWFMNRGPLIDIPTNGGQQGCGGGAPNGCIGGLQPVNGGIPGWVKMAVAPGGSFTVPPSAFKQDLGKQVAAVPFVPTVVQLSSNFSLMGPPTPAHPLVPPGGAAFMKNAWSLDPGQTARAAKSFNWCPVAIGPNCTNSTVGTYTGMVSYKNTNPNAFGGTMAMFLVKPYVVSVIVGTTQGTNLLGHNIGGNPTPQPQHPGRGYSTFDTDMFAAGPINLGFGTNPPCTKVLPASPPGCGQITWSGPTVGALPADFQMNWGFPWTTGTVTAKNFQTNQGQPGTTSLTAMGTDSRTALGAGKITLVAGGHTHRVGANQDYSAIDVFLMTFKPILPSMSRPGLVAAGVLMLLAVGYAYRRRL